MLSKTVLTLTHCTFVRVQCTPFRKVANTVRLYGGGSYAKMIGHQHQTILDIETVADCVPLTPDDTLLRVLVTGAYSEAQMAEAKSWYLVRSAKVLDLLTFVKTVGHAEFVDKTLDMTNIETGESHPFVEQVDSEIMDPEDGDPQQQAEDLTSGAGPVDYSIGLRTTVTVASVDEYTNTAVSPAADLLGQIITRSRRKATADLAAKAKQDGLELPKVKAIPRYHIKTSNSFGADKDQRFFEKAFPFKFPYGRGGLHEPRRTHIGQDAYVDHLVRLSSRNFQCNDFVLHMYNIKARKQQMSSAFIQCKAQNETRGASYATLSEHDVILAHSYAEECSKRAKKGQTQAVPPASLPPAAQSMMRSIRVSCIAAQHTEAHCQAARTKVFAYCYRFGKASWWITFTPDDQGGLSVYCLALGISPGKGDEFGFCCVRLLFG